MFIYSFKVFCRSILVISKFLVNLNLEVVAPWFRFPDCNDTLRIIRRNFYEFQSQHESYFRRFRRK